MINISKIIILKLFIIILPSLLIYASSLYNCECGDYPTLKYKELAKFIGWDWYRLIKFIKTEKPEEYNKILQSVKVYAECIAMVNSPI